MAATGSLLPLQTQVIGSVRKKVDPTPSSDANQKWPPCCSTSSRERYRPSPVPLILQAWAFSARMKRPKICACSRTGMPMPQSWTLIGIVLEHRQGGAQFVGSNAQEFVLEVFGFLECALPRQESDFAFSRNTPLRIMIAFSTKPPLPQFPFAKKAGNPEHAFQEADSW